MTFDHFTVLSIEVVTSRVTELCSHLVVSDSEKPATSFVGEGSVSQSELSVYNGYGVCLKRRMFSDVGDHSCAIENRETALLVFFSGSMIAFVTSLGHFRLYLTSHCVDKTPVGPAVREGPSNAHNAKIYCVCLWARFLSFDGRQHSGTVSNFASNYGGEGVPNGCRPH
jgi:hypothetical protein